MKYQKPKLRSFKTVVGSCTPSGSGVITAAGCSTGGSIDSDCSTGNEIIGNCWGGTQPDNSNCFNGESADISSACGNGTSAEVTG